MLFEQSMHERDAPAIMKAAFRVAPYKLWKRRWNEWAEQEKVNPFLADYFDNQFRIERSFEVTYDYYLSRHKAPQLDPLGYELFSFLALLVGVHARLSAEGQVRLAGSVRHALGDNAGLVPVEVELRVAAHLMQNGFDVEFTDLEGRERFDLLATKPGLDIEIDFAPDRPDRPDRGARPDGAGESKRRRAPWACSEAFRSGPISRPGVEIVPGRVGRHRSSIGSSMIMFSRIVIVMARSNSDEAIQLLAKPMDCFASLA